MGALTPLFLVAALAVGVPIYLHLFQRHETRRLSFPALRYLERTEREHAQRIRLRQMILLLMRVTVLVLLVGAGARLFFNGRGSAHPATAVVLIVDNSMSSGLVVGEARVLDRLKELSHRTLAEASDDDRFWVLRAGEPWLTALPASARKARDAIDAIEPSDAAGDLTAALERAAELLSTSELAHREIHVLADLQKSSFAAGETAPAGQLPVVTWAAGNNPGVTNHALSDVLVGGGLPPLEGHRAAVTVSALDTGDTTRLPIRIVINERIRGAATVPPGSATSVLLPPAGPGWIRGYADTDADALRADDRRYFAYRSRSAPRLAAAGDAGVFTDEAVTVLQTANRVTISGPGDAELLIAAGGDGLDQLGANGAALIVPSPDPTLLPALNRRLAAAGVPWRYEPRTASGSAELTGRSLPEPLEGVRADAWYVMTPATSPTTPTRTLAEAGSDPWAVQGSDALGRRFLLLASALDAESTTLPVSTGMLRFIDWAASEWAGLAGGARRLTTGARLPAPRAATHVRFPSGEEFEIDGTRTVRGTGRAGFYTFLAADTAVAVVALNTPVDESNLQRLSDDELPGVIGPGVVLVERDGDWSRAVFRTRQGPELWWPLLLATVALMLVEVLLAAAGRVETSTNKRGKPRNSPMPNATV
jgi:hypothetical protein